MSDYISSYLSDDLGILWNECFCLVFQWERTCHHTTELVLKRGHNEDGTVCSFNPEKNIPSLATTPGWILLDILMSITHNEERYSPWHFKMTSAGCKIKCANFNSCTFQDPKRKHSPPAVQWKRRKKNCCRCEYDNIFTYARERSNPVGKKNTHSNWQQGVHKEWNECGVWEKRVM